VQVRQQNRETLGRPQTQLLMTEHLGSREDTRREELVLLVHGNGSSPKELKDLRHLIEKTRPGAHVECPRLQTGLFSTADPDTIAVRLVERLDELWEKQAASGHPPYSRITLIGHSGGALLARKVYVLACGENDDAPLGAGASREPREWASRVDRVILVAGMNRGWSFSPHLSLRRALLSRLGAVLGGLRVAPTHKRLLIFQIRRGAPFITQLRIQWLSLRRHALSKGGVGRALTIQLLGSVDDMVSPEDNIDLLAGQDFIYLDVPASGHRDVVRVADTAQGPGRSEVFRAALSSPQEELEARSLLPADMLPAAPDETVSDVIFVVHGIRDEGFWTQHVARKVVQRGKEAGRRFRTETSSYGYFPMLPFVLPWTRRAKVEWLMDRYTENLALYPKAEFSFVGHSNGTYLLSRALKDYPSCRFKHVVFAGSVVHPNYDWMAVVEEGRVSRILNFVASSDWVVALFPKGFSRWGSKDLGGAGHDGFAQEGPVTNIRYVKGGHSAAVKEDYWDTIARFVVDGTQGTELPRQTGSLAAYAWLLGVLSFLVWPLLVVLIILVSAYALLQGVEQWWGQGLAFIGWAVLLWRLVTRL